MSIRRSIIAIMLLVSITAAGCGQPSAALVSRPTDPPPTTPPATAISQAAAMPEPRLQPSGMAITPDGATRLQVLHTLGGHIPSVAGLSFAAGGAQLATVSGNLSLRLWDTAAGQETGRPLDQGDRVYNVAFSPDGALLATEGPEHTIVIWDTASGQELRTLAGHGAYLMRLAFSPDGSRLASAADDNQIKIWDLKSGVELHTLVGHVTPVTALAFSPDGTLLASGSIQFSPILKLWDVARGQHLRTWSGHANNVHNLVFSPDGALLASASADGTVKLWRVKTCQQVLDLSAQGAPVYGLAFSPDGALLATSGRRGEISLWAVGSGQKLHTLGQHQDYVHHLAFSADGTLLASGGVDSSVLLWGIPGEGDGVTDAVPQPQARQIAAAQPVPAQADSSDGLIAFSSYRFGESKIFTMKPDGTDVTPISRTGLRDTRPSWSPDGSKIAYVRRVNSTDHEIYVMNADGSATVCLTNRPDTIDSEPVWSPDGSQIAFISNERPSMYTIGGRFHIWVMNADGSEQRLLTEIGGSNSSPDWSPDGTKIAFDTTRDGNHEIYVINVDGSDPVNLSNHPAHDTSPAWSPDGSQIAFVSDRDGNQEIYLMDADGSNQVRLTDRFGFDKDPAWSPDGQYIVFYSRHEANNTEVYRMRADGSEQVRLTHDADFDGFPSWQCNLPPQAAAAAPTVTPAPAVSQAPPKHPSPAELKVSLTGLPLDEFFEASWREIMLRDPETVLADGQADVYGLQGAELTDISDAYVRQTQEIYALVLDILHSYDRESLSPEQQISYDVYEWFLDDQVRRSEFLYYDYPATFFPVTAVHEQTVDFFTDLHPIANKQDAQDYVTRLGKVETKFEQLLERLKLGEKAGIVPPKFAIQWAWYGVKQMADASPRYTPFYQALEEKLRGLEDMDGAEKEALLALAERTIQQSVLPAYRSLADYLQHQQSVAPSDDGLWQFPQGDDYYAYILRHHNTTDLSADEIYELGLRELDRIHAEMRVLFDELGYPADESLPELFDRVGRDGGYVSGSEVIKTYESLIEEAEQNLDAAFDLRPKADVIVIKSPIHGMYVSASMDGSRPGTFHAGPGNGTEEFYAMPTLAYHEAVPGHHFQISLAQEADLPTFRNSLGFLGYAEGWALYAEQLAWELGWYEDDPYSNLGRLQAEAFRATRLVVDTGLHTKDWTFDQAQDFFTENTGFEKGDSVDPEIAIARYIVWPGQATAYKIGMIKMLELRQKAMEQLGDRFDLKAYHRVVLSNGSMPLEVLERVVDEYIRAELEQ